MLRNNTAYCRIQIIKYWGLIDNDKSNIIQISVWINLLNYLHSFYGMVTLLMASRGINVHSITLNSKIKTLDSVLGTQSHIIVIRFLYFWQDQILSSRIKFWYTLPDKMVHVCFRVLNMYAVKKGFEFKFIIFTTPFTHSVVNSLGAK